MAIRRYRLDITAIGPVHIGNGRQYGKKDYFASGNRVAVLDARKFVSFLDAKQVELYCDFLEDDRDRSGLSGFLRRNPNLSKIAEKSIAYTIDSPLSTARRGAIQYHDVWEFMKDPYNNPYIPGSSVKGMLRTALLLSILLADESFQTRFDAVSKENGAKERLTDKGIVRRALWRERPDASNPSIVNDVMKYVSVSDSAPLPVSDLVFVKKYDKFSKDDPVDHKLDMGKLTLLEGNELDVYRECIRPGASVSIDIAIDDRIDAYLDGRILDAKGLREVLQKAFDFYKQNFLVHFDQGKGEVSSGDSAAADGQCCYVIQSGPLKGIRCPNHAVNGTKYCNKHQDEAAKQQTSDNVFCYLGGGVDFMSKTVVGALSDSENERVKRISHILFSQFPTRVDQSRHSALAREVRRTGFDPKPMQARFGRNGRLLKAKDDHRHWLDQQLGVSPHTMK